MHVSNMLKVNTTLKELKCVAHESIVFTLSISVILMIPSAVYVPLP